MSEDYPTSLRQDDGLRLPPHLWAAYSDVLASHGLLTDCIRGSESNRIHGGASKNDALDHFKYRFANSISRLIYLLTANSSEMRQQRDDIFRIMQTGSVRILDLVGGTGAGVIGIISALVHLRSEGALATLPLNIEIYAADISPDALKIYSEMLRRLDDVYSKFAVKIIMHPYIWNACDVSETSQICDHCVSAANGCFAIVLVSNLSGIGKSSLDALVRSFQHVNERIAANKFPWYWIEPGNSGGVGFLQKVKKTIFDAASWATRKTSITSEHSYDWWHELQTENKKLSGSMIVLKYDR